MVTYNIMLSSVFPSWHRRKGEPTEFRAHLGNVKLHALFAYYALWQRRFEKIAHGEAEIVVREWTGKPFRSKTMVIARYDNTSGIGLQQLTFEQGDYGLYCLQRPLVDGMPVSIDLLARNDGLSYEDWHTLFLGYDLSSPIAVIHFTPFRY